MNKNYLRTLTGLLLIATPIAFMAAFTLLQINFEYPAILREPTSYVLEKFNAGGRGLIATWYAFMLTAIMFVPIAVMLRPFLAGEGAAHMPLATTLGVLAGVVQFLGLVRWPFVVPYLAQTYFDPASTPAGREAVEVIFQAFHRYAGAGIGETLGYIFTGGWTLLVSLAMIKSSNFKAWIGWLGIPLALAILAGLFEGMGAPLAGAINAIGYTVWAGWLILVGVALLRAKGEQA
jgi:hypothetical protein